jgi:3-methyladenine DNA glycosylase/8-oxoguanine DNA glycosylase
MSLHRTDIFPVGNLATVKALNDLDLVKPGSSKEELSDIWKNSNHTVR